MREMRTRQLPIRFGMSGILVLVMAVAAAPTLAGDWPNWGHDDSRNMATDEKGLPTTFGPGGEKTEGDKKVPVPPENVKWSVKLGSQSYGNTTVAGGRVYVGTNDANLRDPRLKKTGGGVVMCLEEATGKLLWQLVVPRLKTRNKDFNYDDLNLGICSTTSVDGDRVYVVTNRCEVLCLDVKGMADGNDGPFKEEGQYMVGPGELESKPGPADKGVETRAGPTPPVTTNETDADILWCYNIFAEVDNWVQDAADCSILVQGDYLYVCTSQGVDRSHKVIPRPEAPDVIVLDKKTGKLVAKNDPPIGKAIFHGEWSSPSFGKVGEKGLVFWGGGDGLCYAFDAEPAAGEGDKPGLLKTVWKFDCNPPHNKMKDDRPLPYNKGAQGPSEIIGTPVFYKNRVYVAVGQDSRHGNGAGCLSCIDVTKTGDVTETAKVWQCFGVQRSFSTVSICDNLVFEADYAGIVHCLDADTGEVYWKHDLGAHVWGSTMAADGKVYVGDEKGKVTVLAASKEKKVLHEVSFGAPVYLTPVAANGVLYIGTQTSLYAFQLGTK